MASSFKSVSKGSFSERFPPEGRTIVNPIIDDRVGYYVIEMTGSGLKSITQARDQLHIALERAVRENPSIGVYQIKDLFDRFIVVLMNNNGKVSEFLQSSKFGAAISKKVIGANRVTQIMPMPLETIEQKLTPYGKSVKSLQNWPLVKAFLNKQLGGPLRSHRALEVARMMKEDDFKFITYTHMIVKSLSMKPAAESKDRLHTLEVGIDISTFNGIASPKHNKNLATLLSPPEEDVPLQGMEFSINDFYMTAPPVKTSVTQAMDIPVEEQLQKQIEEKSTGESAKGGVPDIFDLTAVDGYLKFIEEEVKKYIIQKYPGSKTYAVKAPYEMEVPAEKITEYEEGFKNIQPPKIQEVLPASKFTGPEQEAKRPTKFEPLYPDGSYSDPRVDKLREQGKLRRDAGYKIGAEDISEKTPTTTYRIIGERMNFVSRGIVNEVVVDAEVVPYGDESKKETIQIPIKMNWSSGDMLTHPNLNRLVNPDAYEYLFDEYGGAIDELFKMPADIRAEENPFNQRAGALGDPIASWRPQGKAIGKGNEHYFLNVFEIDYDLLVKEQQEVDFNPLATEKEKEIEKDKDGMDFYPVFKYR